MLKKKVLGDVFFFTLLPQKLSRELCQPTLGIEPFVSLQKKRHYDDFSDDEENENNSSISNKFKEETKEKSENNPFVSNVFYQVYLYLPLPVH